MAPSYGSIPRTTEGNRNGRHEEESLLIGSSGAAATATINNAGHDRIARSYNDDKLVIDSGRWAWLVSSALALLAILLVVVHPTKEDLIRHIELYSSEPFFYMDQLIDHNASPIAPNNKFSQRYYEKKSHFHGPGHPIFLIIGGEDPLEGLLYPFVHHTLAHHFHAYTASLEHRFFGTSVPEVTDDGQQLHHVLTPHQALDDIARFVQHKRQELGCSLDRTNPRYCPVIAVGGSYPGFLAALLRWVHPDVVDASYASSAPLQLYEHSSCCNTTTDVLDANAYYDKVTEVAEEAYTGCAASVGQTLERVNDALLLHAANSSRRNEEEEDRNAVDAWAVQLGICAGSVPDYIQTLPVLATELMMVIATHFANANMDYYPPSRHTDLYRACRIFTENTASKTPPETSVAEFLQLVGTTNTANHGDDDDSTITPCFDLSSELPPGPNAEISASDWSGVGGGPAGYYWDFLSCQLLPATGFSARSMFPTRPWTIAWEKRHCEQRFGWTPDPPALVQEFHFDDLSNVTRLLFTNGMNDGWSVASILEERKNAPGVRVVNMEHGAHHSDLSHHGPSIHDTADVKEAFKEVTHILEGFLHDIRTTS